MKRPVTKESCGQFPTRQILPSCLRLASLCLRPARSRPLIVNHRPLTQPLFSPLARPRADTAPSDRLSLAPHQHADTQATSEVRLQRTLLALDQRRGPPRSPWRLWTLFTLPGNSPMTESHTRDGCGLGHFSVTHSRGEMSGSPTRCLLARPDDFIIPDHRSGYINIPTAFPPPEQNL